MRHKEEKIEYRKSNCCKILGATQDILIALKRRYFNEGLVESDDALMKRLIEFNCDYIHTADD